MWELLKPYPNIGWIVLFVTVIGGLFRILIAHLSLLHSVKQKNLDMFLSKIEKGKEASKSDRFGAEQLFFNMYKLRLEYDSIMLILNSHFPLKSFDLYKKVHHYIEVSEKKEKFKSAKDFKTISVGKCVIAYRVGVKEFLLYMIFMTVSLLAFAGLYVLFVAWPPNYPLQFLAVLSSIILVLIAVTFFILGLKYLERDGIRYLDDFLKLQKTDVPKTEFKL